MLGLCGCEDEIGIGVVTYSHPPSLALSTCCSHVIFETNTGFWEPSPYKFFLLESQFSRKLYELHDGHIPVSRVLITWFLAGYEPHHTQIVYKLYLFWELRKEHNGRKGNDIDAEKTWMFYLHSLSLDVIVAIPSRYVFGGRRTRLGSARRCLSL